MKKKIVVLFLTLLNVVPVFADAPPFGQCGGFQFPATVCTAGYTCVAVNDYYSQCLPGSNSGPITFSLIAPPGTARKDFSAGQSISVTITNQNTLGVTMTLQPKYGTTQAFVLFPFGSSYTSWDVFAQTPVSWYLIASTNASAALVSISIKSN
jgi:hypothetical protein